MAAGLAMLAARPAAAQGPASRSTPPPAAADVPTGLHLLGGPDALFAVLNSPPAALPGTPSHDGSDQPQGQSIVFRREKAANRWAQFSGLFGQVRGVTFYRSQLAVLTDGGTWRAVFEGGSALGSPLPPGHRAQAIAGTPTTLYALTRVGEDVRLLRLGPGNAATGAWEELGSLRTGGGLDARVRPAGGSGTATGQLALLARQVGGTSQSAAGVSEAAGGTTPHRDEVYIALTTEGGRVAIVCATVEYTPDRAPADRASPDRASPDRSIPDRSIPDQPNADAATSPSLLPPPPVTQPAAFNTPPATLGATTRPKASVTGVRVLAAFNPGLPSVAQLRLFDVRPDGSAGMPPVLWVDPGRTSGGTVFVVGEPGAGDTPRGISMGDRPGEAVYFAERLRFFFDRDEKSSQAAPDFFEQAYDLAGNKVGEPTPVTIPLVLPGIVQVMNLIWWMAIAGLMFGMLLSWRRRTELTPDSLQGAMSLPLAPRFLRLLADLVDASPCIAFLGYLLFTHGDAVSDVTLTPRELFLALLSVAVVVTHTLLCEVMFGRSAGKALFGLRVVALNGQRAMPGDVVVGNLLKSVELIFLGLPYITMLLSPLRQSFSDSAAGLLVVSDDLADKGPGGNRNDGSEHHSEDGQ